MPKDFETCRKAGGRIRTLKVGKDKYMHVCWDKAGKSHAGEVQTKQSKE